ncbi:MAG: 2-phosphosulfolactate phosphatase [Microbacterium sp.]|uniref:2-phosphosulfolactate phosphatase n=1 Tax=Microbacterium sp. TaxID=51671 RepID=UPI001AC25FDC|nr:2-phosphosulfolactate phosphatase [Microbacterium sp.]MBN9155062.1 2-phosphosulfolactate phosphatase [Microbacterium sp.]MBN9173836.1 2-phosphosulfolactate phosphatase [Microbacterium sp.]
MPPFDQARYQVRLEWGAEGLARLAPADVVVVVDVLRLSTTVADAVSRGEHVPLAAAEEVSINGAPIARAAAASGAVVLLGGLRNAAAVARAVRDEQHRRGARTSVTIVAAGERTAKDAAAPVRFAVEDQLGAGAVVDALGVQGIDHTSPEAAAAAEAFRGLRGAVRHLLTASGSGQELIERGLRGDVLTAAALSVVDAVPVLRDGVFVAI